MAREGATRRRFLQATGGAVVGGGVLSKFSHHARAQSDEIPQSDPVWTFEGPSEGFVNTTIHNGNVYVYSSQFSKLFSINSANGSVEWDFEVEEGIFSIQIINNIIYISSYGNSIYAIEPSSVNELWKYDTSDVPRRPYILDNTVYVGDYAGNAYAINAEDGTEQWTRNFETGGSPVSIDVLDSDLVHLGAAGLQSHFVEPASGNTLWNLPLNGSWAHAKLDGNTVYLSVLQDSIYALTKSNGTQQWRFESASGYPIIDNNTLYASGRYNNEDTDFFAINTIDGAEKWSLSTDIPIWSSKIKNNTIYLGGRGDGTGAVYAVDISSGEQLWEFKPDDEVLGSPEFTNNILYNNILYIGSKDSYAYALDATSGEELWNFQTGGQVWNVMLNNGELYLGSNDGTVYKFAGNAPVVVGDDPATDPDNDGKFEDVNGNGQLDIGDVQALFSKRNSDTVQNNVAEFDFNGNSGIDIGDIQALFNEYATQ